MKALCRILFQAVPHNTFHRWRNIEGSFREFRRFLFEDRAHGIGCCFTMKCAFSGDHLVNNGAEGEDVRASICVFPSDLLRGHIADRIVPMTTPGSVAACMVGASPPSRANSGRVSFAKPGNLGFFTSAVIGDEKVFRFQVAMHDPLVVGSC